MRLSTKLQANTIKSALLKIFSISAMPLPQKLMEDIYLKILTIAQSSVCPSQLTADSRLHDQLFELPEKKEIFLWTLAFHTFTLVNFIHRKAIHQQMRTTTNCHGFKYVLRPHGVVLTCSPVEGSDTQN